MILYGKNIGFCFQGNLLIWMNSILMKGDIQMIKKKDLVSIFS